MKDKKLEEAVDYVCSCCPYIFSGSAEWDKSNPTFADWRDSATKYCDRCMVRKMTDFYNALDEHEFSEGIRSSGDCLRSMRKSALRTIFRAASLASIAVAF